MTRYATLTLVVVLACLSFADAASAQKRFDGVTLNINGFGGAFDEALKKGVAAPLKEKYGLEVVYNVGLSSAQVAQTIASKDNPPFDLMMIDSPSMPDAISNEILEPITTAEVPNAADLMPGAREFHDFGMPFTFAGIVLLYNTKTLKAPPLSLNELVNPALKGRVAIFNLESLAGVLTLLALAESNGGGVENVQPGFDKLKAMKPNFATTSASIATLVQLFEQGEVDVGVMWNGRAALMKEKGLPLDYVVPKEGFYSVLSYVNIIKNTKHKDAALAYVNQALSVEAGEALARGLFYPSTNTKMVLSEDLAQKVIGYGPEAKKALKTLNWTEAAKQRPAWMEQWNREMAR